MFGVGLVTQKVKFHATITTITTIQVYTFLTNSTMKNITRCRPNGK